MKHLLTHPKLAGPLAQAGVRTADDLLTLAQPLDSHNVGARIDLDLEGTNGRFYLKAYRYPGWRKSKGLIGRGSLWGKAPCVREFRNLAWLRRHGILAARPVAAASVAQAGRLVAHALLTEWVDDAPTLARLLDEGCNDVESVMGALGRAVGSMHHRERFAHGDLFCRNILVRMPEVWLLDCRRGRPRASQVALRRDVQGLRDDLVMRVTPRALDVFGERYDRERSRRS